MAKFNRIPEAKAPRPLRQSGRLAMRMRQYEEFVGGLKSGDVGEVTPDSGETPRGIALRIGRAARRVGRSADTWIVNGVVYTKIS